MRKLLITLTAITTFNSVAAQPPSVFKEGDVFYNTSTKEFGASYMYAYTDSLTNKFSISGVLFTEQYRNHFEVIGGVGLTYTPSRNVALSAMVGFVNKNPMPAIVIAGYLQSPDRKITGIFYLLGKNGEISPMVEALYCFESKNEKFEIAGGGLWVGTFIGPYLRISSNSYYIGFNPATNAMPKIGWQTKDYGSTTTYNSEHMPHVSTGTGEKREFVLRIIVGIELFSPNNCNRCKTIH